MNSLKAFFILGLTLAMALACSRKTLEDQSPAVNKVFSILDYFKTASTGPTLSFNNLTGGVNSIAINPQTRLPAVAYYDKSSTASGTTALGALKYAYMDAAGSWNIEIVDVNYGSAACGTANSYCVGAPNAATGSLAQIISLDFKSDGTPAIAYVYGASGATASATKQIRLAERNAVGDPNNRWNKTIAYQSSTAALATNVATAATVDPMKSISLSFDSSDRPHITFAMYTQTIVNSKIKYLFRDGGNNWQSNDIGAAVSGTGTVTVLGQGMNSSSTKMCGASGPVGTAFEVTAAAGVGRTKYFYCSAMASGMCTAWAEVNLQTGCSASTCFSSGLTTTGNSGSRTSLILDSNNYPVIGVYSTTLPATSLLVGRAPSPCSSAQPTTAGSWGSMYTVGSASHGANGFGIAASATEWFVTYLLGTTAVHVNKCDSAACSFFATGTAIETATVAGEGVGIAYDSTDGNIFTSYARIPAAAAGAAGNDIMVSAGLSTGITSGGNRSFMLHHVDQTSNVFPLTAVPTISAATSAQGQIGFAYFYQDFTAGDAKLYYGIRSGSGDNATFATNFVTSHQESTAGNFVGTYPALIFDGNNNPAIAYYNGVDASLSIARSSNRGVNFSVSVIEDHASDVIGQYPSLERYGNVMGIAYYDVTNTSLKFARTNNAGNWLTFVVDGAAGTGSCGNAADNAGAYARLRFTSTGRPVILYNSNFNLKIAYASDGPTSSTYNWSCVTLDASGNLRGQGIDFILTDTDAIELVHFDATAGIVRSGQCAASVASCVAQSAQFNFQILDAIGTTTTIVTIPKIQYSSLKNTVYASYYSSSYQGLALASKALGEVTWTKEYLDTKSDGGSYTSLAGQYSSLTLNEFGLPTIFYRSRENWIRYFAREQQ